MSGWMSPTREEWEMEQIRADMALTHARTQWEPWKAMAAAVGAGATFATAFGAIIVYVLSHVMR